jgi:hypothetical protein
MMFALSGSRQEDQTTELESSESEDSEEEKRDWTAEQWHQSDEWQETAQGLWETTVEEELKECGFRSEDPATVGRDLEQKICRVRLGVMDITMRCDSDDAAKEVSRQQLWEHFLAEDDEGLQGRYADFLSRCWETSWNAGRGVPLSHWKPVQDWENQFDSEEPKPRMFHLLSAGSGKMRGLPEGSARGGVGAKVRGLPGGSREN